MTRRFLVGCSLACALLFAVAASAAAPTNFAGTWVLDKSKSKDLPQQWADNLESYTLTVTQDEKQLTVENKLNWKEGGGPGGGQASGAGGRAAPAAVRAAAWDRDAGAAAWAGGCRHL